MNLAGFEILGELGRGGMGIVYRVKAPGGGEAALKLLPRADPGALARFERERRLLASLGEKEGFVGLLAAGSSPQGPWLLMPLVPGGTLRQRLDAGPLGVEETISFGTQLAQSLGRAHERGIVHRDVKPENVLFTRDGRPLLADLGLAKHFDRSAQGGSQSLSQTAHGTLKGTAGYIAPEQVEDARIAGPAADVFALGAVLYECLAGHPAFQAPSVLEVLAKLSSGSRERIARPDVPAWLEGVLEKALAPPPADRFADGASLARALLERGLKKKTRPRTWAFLAAGAAVGALVLATLAPTRHEAPPPPAPRPPAPKETLPPGLEATGRKVPAADGKEVPLSLFHLPDGTDMELVAVPAGEFVMGTDAEDAFPNEKPRHSRVLARASWIGRNDVTWKQYLAFCSATGREEPRRPAFVARLSDPDDHPVVNVSWDDARAYCEWAHLALPDETLWEKAARGTDGRKWPWGNDWDPGSRCNFADASCRLDGMPIAGGKTLADYFKETGKTWDREHSDGHEVTSAVGSYPRGVSPVGALDMAGNVVQWCENGETGYAAASDVPENASRRIHRGGGWLSEARSCTSTGRGSDPPDTQSSDLGFRAVLRD